MAKPETVIVKVVRQQQYDPGPFYFGGYEDGSLDRVIECLVEIRGSIPEQYRKTAQCEIDAVSGYDDSCYANIEISYSRPETPEETARRTEEAARAKRSYRSQRTRRV